MRSLADQLQPLRIKDEQIALQTRHRNHALDHELGQLYHHAGRPDLLNQRGERRPLRGVGLTVKVFQLLQLYRLLLRFGRRPFRGGEMQRQP